MVEMIKDGSVILLEQDTTLATVLKRCNGLTVDSKKIMMDDLLNSFLEMVESFELVKMILGQKDKDLLQEVFKPVIDDQDPQMVYQMLSLIFDRCESEQELAMISVIFRSVAEKFDLSQVEPKSLNLLLGLLLERVRGVEDESIFNEMFLTLLKKVSISSCSKGLLAQLLEQLARRAVSERDQDVKAWFRSTLAAYMPKSKTVFTPVLPKGTILYQEESDGSKIVVFEIEKEKRDVIFHTTPFKEVGHPKLLFEFAVQGSRISYCKIFAVKDAVIKPSTKLYRYPFSNVFEDFRACWPDLSSIKVEDLHQLRNLPMLFFNSPSNNHAFQGTNLRELFVNLEGQDFDDSTLVDTGLTFEEHFELDDKPSPEQELDRDDEMEDDFDDEFDEGLDEEFEDE